MRAKSIKNTARVNAELSPTELKGLLKKAQIANASHQAYIAALEAELSVWRSGGHVEHAEYAAADKPGAPLSAPKKSPIPSTPSTVRSLTPSIPAVESLRGDLDSRPQTPTVVGLDKDEREDFLKRENELSDQLAEKESALVAQQKLVQEIREELTFVKDSETSLSKAS
jgi:kinesin family member 5